MKRKRTKDENWSESAKVPNEPRVDEKDTKLTQEEKWTESLARYLKNFDGPKKLDDVVGKGFIAWTEMVRLFDLPKSFCKLAKLFPVERGRQMQLWELTEGLAMDVAVRLRLEPESLPENFRVAIFVNEFMKSFVENWDDYGFVELIDCVADSDSDDEGVDYTPVYAGEDDERESKAFLAKLKEERWAKIHKEYLPKNNLVILDALSYDDWKLLYTFCLWVTMHFYTEKPDDVNKRLSSTEIAALKQKMSKCVADKCHLYLVE